MKISVIVLTCNRAALLRACLEALASQSRPADEILVADTGSTDTTPDVLNAFRERLSQSGRTTLRVLSADAGRGWAGVRNEGARASTGDWIAFTDDDCEPAPDWLVRVEANAARGLDAVGGLVEPAGHLRFPWWWHPDMGWAAGLSVPGHKGLDAGRVYYPQTANWAMRRAVLLQEPFQELAEASLVREDSEVPAQKRLYTGGREDAELWRRLRLHGWRTGFDAAMRVTHHIPQERLKARALLRRAFQDGLAAQRREPLRPLLEWAVGDLVRTPARLLVQIGSGSESPWSEAAWNLVWTVRQAGQCAGWAQRQGAARGATDIAGIAARTLAGLAVGTGKALVRRARVAFHRVARPPVPRPSRPRSVLVLAVGYVGDMALLHPFLTSLKTQRPEVEITLVTGPKGEEIYRSEPSLSALFVVGGRDPGERDEADRTLRRALAAQKPDLVLVPYCYGLLPKPLFRGDPVRVVTFAEEVGFSRRLWYDLADVRIPKPPGRSESENLYRVFREAGLEGRLMRAPLAFEPDEVVDVTHAIRQEGLSEENLVVIAPGSGKPNKLWREERWAEIVRYLMQDYEMHVALAGAPFEADLCERIARASGCEPSIWCEPSLRTLTLRVSRARLLLSTDNGVRYLAAGMDTPTLALFGPTDERQWRPLAEPLKHGVVRACPWDLTLEERAGLPERYQMDRIRVEQVRSALDEMLRDDI